MSTNRKYYVISAQSVQWAIGELKNQSIHPFFIAYLVLRKRSMELGESTFTVDWEAEIASYLRVDGGGETRPYYRPFFNQKVQDESRYWLNRNLAGSFAPSSIRRAAGSIASGAGRSYTLSDNHVEKASKTLLKDVPVNIHALAIYLLRNRLFGGNLPPNHQDAILAFRKLFIFGSDSSGNSDFNKLFALDNQQSLPTHLFEPFHGSVQDMSFANYSNKKGISTTDIRMLTATDLGIGYDPSSKSAHATNEPVSPIDPLDPLLLEVLEAAKLYGGVIFTGPPGTSKSYNAAMVASHITKGVPERVRFVQMHASYQYEDFMEGYVPDPENGGFRVRQGHLVDMAARAEADPENEYVMVIDELSRADVGRVFGEALTYVERSKRSLEFSLPSGHVINIPSNLILLMTMNPLDKGVDEVDAAFERRFAKVSFDPDTRTLMKLLENNGLEENLRNRVRGWFHEINAKAKENPQASLGHTLFTNISNVEDLKKLWSYQIKYHVDRAFRYDHQGHKDTINGWNNIFIDNEIGND